MEVENAKNMGKFITQNANQDMIILDAAFVGQTLQIVEPLDQEEDLICLAQKRSKQETLSQCNALPLKNMMLGYAIKNVQQDIQEQDLYAGLILQVAGLVAEWELLKIRPNAAQ